MKGQPLFFKQFKTISLAFVTINPLEYPYYEIIPGEYYGSIHIIENLYIDMKYTTIRLGNNTIELFNSLLGKETVKVDGEIVSSKYSMRGADHGFTIMENGRQVECSAQFGFGLSGVVFDLYKDGQPIIESEKSSFLGFISVIGVIIAIAVTIVLLS